MSPRPVKLRRKTAPTGKVPAVVWEFLRAELDPIRVGCFGVHANPSVPNATIATAFLKEMGVWAKASPVTVLVERPGTGLVRIAGRPDPAALATVEASRIAVRHPQLGLGGARVVVSTIPWDKLGAAIASGAIKRAWNGHLVTVASGELFDAGLRQLGLPELADPGSQPVVALLDKPIGITLVSRVLGWERIGPGLLDIFWLSDSTNRGWRAEFDPDPRAIDDAAARLARRFRGPGTGRGIEPGVVDVLRRIDAELRRLIASAAREGAARGRIVRTAAN
jgi:hypothetical protein